MKRLFYLFVLGATLSFSSSSAQNVAVSLPVMETASLNPGLYGNDEPFLAAKNGRPKKNFASMREKENPDEKVYGKNFFSFSPIFITNTSISGIGISYERTLDPKTILSLYIPVAFSFKNEQYGSLSSGYYNKEKRNMLWAYQGLKIYPTGSKGIVRYALGSSLVIGSGNEEKSGVFYNYLTGQYEYRNQKTSVFVLGVMFNNSLNIQPTPKLKLGVELGFGIPYYTSESGMDPYYNYESSYKNEPLVQLNFFIGYRI